MVERIGSVAIYRKSKPSIGYAGYEVIRVLPKRPHPMDKNKDLYDMVECYPASYEWGTYGWTYQNLPAARMKMEALLQ